MLLSDQAIVGPLDASGVEPGDAGAARTPGFFAVRLFLIIALLLLFFSGLGTCAEYSDTPVPVHRDLIIVRRFATPRRIVTLDPSLGFSLHRGDRVCRRPAGFCDEDPRVVASRGTELVGWYIEQQRERARLVWRDYDPAMCRPITKAIMRATSDSPPAHILANPHPPKCANRAQSSASAPLRNASALSRFIRQWALKR